MRLVALVLLVGCALPLSRHDRHVLAAQVAGAGALTVAAGIAEAFEAKDARDRARHEGCISDLSQCPPAALGTANDAYSKGNYATGFLVGGAVVMAAGAVIWLTAPDDDAWRVSPTGTGLTVGRGF